MTTFTQTPTAAPLRAALSRIFARLGEIGFAVGHARARTAEVEALMALSDQALAAKGLRRSDIVHHVYRDSVYL
ncbi:MAG: DUF1127 domain-containing protein [Shimia sp.]